MPPSSDSSVVGLVLGSQDATPLEFWVGVGEGGRLQLDDLVVTKTTLNDGEEVTFYGIVDIVRKRFEGSQFDTDAFRVADWNAARGCVLRGARAGDARGTRGVRAAQPGRARGRCPRQLRSADSAFRSDIVRAS